MKSILLSIIVFVFSISTVQSQWISQTSGTTSQLYSVSAVNNNVVWICGASGTVLRTTNGGDNWLNASSPPIVNDVYNIFGIDECNALVTRSTSTEALVWKTTNCGTTWVEVFNQPMGYINAIEIGPGGTGLMVGNPLFGKWSIWRTADYGATWDSSGMLLPQAGTEAGYRNSLYASGTSYWFGTNNNRIYYTPNSGVTWNVQATPDLYSYAIWFNSLVGLAGGIGGMKTTDGGTNWAASTFPGSSSINCIAGTGSTFWISRNNLAIYKTSNAGENWTTDYTSPQIVLDIAIARTGNRLWAVGLNGSISRSEGAVSINNISSNVPDRYSLSQNYPNPFNPSSKIQFDITKADFVSLKVYNTLGQEVSKLVNENLSPGTYEVTFDGAGLNSGIYFYTLRIGEFTETKKMVLVK